MSGTRHKVSRWFECRDTSSTSIMNVPSRITSGKCYLTVRQHGRKRQSLPAKSCRVWTVNCDPDVIGGWRSPTSLQMRCTSSLSVPNMHLPVTSSLACEWRRQSQRDKFTFAAVASAKLPMSTRRGGVITQHIALQEAVDCCGRWRAIQRAR